MEVDGDGERGVLLVGEAPGADEDEQGKPFVGAAGQHLMDTFRRVGYDMRRDCWIYNALICRPPNNRTPDPEEIADCRPNLLNTIKRLNPRVIILAGKSPVISLIGHVWKENIGEGLARWVGWQIPCRDPNAWICPTWHPSYCSRMLRAKNPVAQLELEEHLDNAMSLTDRPWKDKEMWPEDRIHLFTNPDDAVASVRVFCSSKRPVAFDFETDRLKPDCADSEIVCCSLSDGLVSVAFPWRGQVIDEMRKFLASPVPKIGAINKFETRWVRREYGLTVRNWLWDVVVNAHILDSRRGITSVKFQSFVRLGADSYDADIKAFLEQDGGNDRNRIHQVPIEKVLCYCALDSMYEWLIAEQQMKEAGFPTP